MKNKNDKAELESAFTATCEGLIYVSEIDADVFPVSGRGVRETTAEGYLEALGKQTTEKIQSVSPDQFFDRLTAKKVWHGKRDKDNAEKWKRLKELMDANLSQSKVLRVGNIRIDIYVVGVDKNGNISGVKTKAVET